VTAEQQDLRLQQARICSNPTAIDTEIKRRRGERKKRVYVEEKHTWKIANFLKQL